MARDLRKRPPVTGMKTLYIEPGSSSENGCCESFNAKLPDEFLNAAVHYFDADIASASRDLFPVRCK
jgi:hypothetical protein